MTVRQFDFHCHGQVIILIVRMSQLHIQILGNKQSDESSVIRLRPLVSSRRISRL